MEEAVVAGDKYSLPFSRGILAKSIQVVGVEPKVAYEIATDIQKYLVSQKIRTVTRDSLRELTYKKLKKYTDKKKADKFLKFRQIKAFQKPLIILLGGSTGSGKSTISVELAHKLDITTVIPTDIIREIMRYMISEKLMPYLHQSSYLGWKKLDISTETDSVILAFEQQSARINVGIRGIIERAIREKSSVIINGVHILPDLIQPKQFTNANIIILFTYVRDPEVHKRRFYYREESGEVRSASRYIKNFEHIRKIQDYVIDKARKRNFPCVDNVDSTEATQWIIDYIIEKVG